MAILFGYLLANYNINTTIERWVHNVENDILSGIIIENTKSGGFDSVSDYLADENKKVIEEFAKFEQMLLDEGFDSEKDYDYEEFLEILERVTEKMNKKYPETSDK